MCMYHTCSVSLYSVVNTWCNWVNSRSCADHLINAQHCGRWLQLRVDGELGKITGKLQEGEPAPLLLPCLTLTLPYPYPAYLTLLWWYSYLALPLHYLTLTLPILPYCGDTLTLPYPYITLPLPCLPYLIEVILLPELHNTKALSCTLFRWLSSLCIFHFDLQSAT